jgi:hypothetical protein
MKRSITTPDGKAIDTEEVDTAEDRVHEIALVTPLKAPELMSVFSRACFKLARILREAHLSALLTDQALSRRRAIVMLDVVPEQLVLKKLSNNDAHRQAILDLDPEYADLHLKSQQWDVIVAYLKRQADNMEGALNAVKKAIQDQEGVYRRANYNMSDISTESVQESVPVQTTNSGFKIGKVQY